NLTVCYTANITFDQKYVLEGGGDYGYVEIKNNVSSSWDTLLTMNGEQLEWTQTTINITSYVGNYCYIRFRFQSDLTIMRSGWYLDDILVTAEQNLFPPVLDQGQVTPTTGNTTTIFNYTVLYTDIDNNKPALIWINIDGSFYTMGKQNPSDVNYRDGCLFQYLTTLDNSTHDFRFVASDGMYLVGEPLTGNYSGPIVSYINLNPPTLANGGVSTLIGDTATTFDFEVTYTDIENKEPSSIEVTINGTPYSMTKQNGTDEDYTDGCIYEYSTTLGEGEFIFHFNASDGDFNANDPQNGYYSGILVAQALTNNVPFTGTVSGADVSDGFRFQVYNYDWGVIGMRPSGGNNFDLTYHDLYNYSDLVAGSYESGSTFEFIGINGHDYASSDYHYAQVVRVSGTGSYDIEAEYSVPDQTVPGGPYAGTISANELLDCFEMGSHTPGIPYIITVDVPSGLDLSVYVMNETGPKSQAIASSNLGGDGIDENLTVILTSSTWFAIILVNENDGTGSYSFSIGVDTTPPDVSIESPLDQVYLINTIDVNLSSSAPDLDSMWFRVRNESGWVTNNITWYEGVNVTLDDGNYTLFAWGNDTQGYTSSPSIVDFIVNSNPPPLVIASPLNITYWEGTVLINLSSSASDLAMVWYRLFNLSSSSWIDTTDITYVSPANRTLPDGLYRIFA
ncbi:MAG: hypothetical protein ACTSQQ_17220, partial [Candidatus Helarchaeota archaeon]